MMDADLDWGEVLGAAITACIKVVRNRSNGSEYALHGDFGGGVWERCIESDCAEKATAKRLDKYWHDGLNKRFDIGKDQVRWTAEADGHLILHDYDKDDDPFILTTGRAPHFVIRGWLLGREGKLPKYWNPKARRPAFFVPQPLRPIESLKEYESLN